MKNYLKPQSRFVLFLTLFLLIPWQAIAGSLLDEVTERGYIIVATPGDYKPFTHWDENSKTYQGLDIDATRELAKALGVEVRFVPTSWPTLMSDFLAGKSDLVVGGIGRTLVRNQKIGITNPYLKIGKSPFIRKADSERFKTLADIDQPGVRVAVNPGGSNQLFVNKELKKATILVFEDNLSIPERIIKGEADVMITDNVEAIIVSAMHPDELMAVAPYNTYTHDDLGYLTRRDDQPFLNWLNLWIHQMKADGQWDVLVEKWIGVSPDEAGKLLP